MPDTKPTAVIYVRVAPEEKARYERQARSEGRSLSNWVRQVLTREVERREEGR